MQDLRIGLGLDTHRLAAGRTCRLGGIIFDSPVGPVAHSDGDVVLHALTDAVLGASGSDDLGSLFPDDDPTNAARDSAEFCAEACRRIEDDGFRVLSLDVVVEAEAPKLADRRAAMRQRIAELFGVTVDRVNVRGKTAEKLGAVGRGEAIRATAVALLLRQRST